MKATILSILIATIFSLTLNAQNNLAGNTLDYDGTNTSNFGNVDFSFEEEMTVMLWVKWSIDPATGNKWANMITINSDEKTDKGQFWIQHNSNNSKFEFALTTEGTNGQMSRNFIFSTTTPQQDEWYHIAAVYTGSKMNLYVNGVLENSRNKSGNIYPSQDEFILTIASWAVNHTEYRAFEGQIDEVSIWNRALTEVEINETMNNLLIGDENNLLAYYRFDELDVDIIEDLSSNDHNGNNVSLNGGSPASLVNSTAPIFGVLPIVLISFEAETDDSEVELTWSSASEINNEYYTIFRSTDGQNWEEIGTVNGAGNSSSILDYTFTDFNANSTKLYYKLRQTDFDGKFEEFDILSVEIEIDLSEISLYPNPAQNEINLSYLIDINSNNLNVVILNSMGQVLLQENINSSDFTSTQSFDISNFSNGVYYLQINNSNDNVYRSSFIVSK